MNAINAARIGKFEKPLIVLFYARIAAGPLNQHESWTHCWNDSITRAGQVSLYRLLYIHHFRNVFISSIVLISCIHFFLHSLFLTQRIFG